MKTFIKDPADVLDYSIDWEDWLDTNEVIASSTWTVDDGITKDSDSYTDLLTIIWLSGGTEGEYTIANKIATSDLRTCERSFVIRIEQR